MTNHGFIFAGGGTGGHLYPGLAIAEQLRQRLGDRADVLFLCSDRAVDRTVLEPEGVAWRALPAKPPGVKPMTAWRFIKNWGASVRAARHAIAQMQSRCERVHVLAMGGFVAAPAVMAARAQRAPIVLVNLDATPGRANRWVAKHAAQSFTQMPVSDSFASRWTLVPPIVRAEATAPGDAATCKAQLGLDPARPVLMVTGGSLGAGSINQWMMAAAADASIGLKGGAWQVLHQCGSKDADALRAAYAKAGVSATVEPFVKALGQWWGAADLAVSRAGAGSVAEAWANRVPTLFLPYPYHKDQHQKANAKRLVDAGGAVVIDDGIDAARNAERVSPALRELVASAERRAAMQAALQALGSVDGASKVAEAIITDAHV